MNKKRAIKELIAVDRLYYEELKKQGKKAWISVYAKDAILVAENNDLNIIGREDIEKYVDLFLDDEAFEVFFEPLSADISDDFTLGYIIGDYTMKNKVNGKLVNSIGKYLFVWKKYDGEWKVSANISNG